MRKLSGFFLSLGLCLALATGISSAQTPDPRFDVCGQVRDSEGHPIPGVVVSDNYSVTITDEDGRYSFVRTPASNWVFISLPSGYEVPLRQGHPCFYRKLDDKRLSYDFVLEKMRKEEKSFNLFFIGDPQCQNTLHVNRLKTEGIPDVKAYSRKQKGNCYAVTLGDIAYTEGGRNTNYLLPIIREEMAADKAGMPVFQTVGNHDFEFAAGVVDEINPTPALRRNRMFEAVFGPVDYSWNRGDVHIVSMNNVRFEGLEKPGNYSAGFSDEQLEWLRRDLSYVPKDKMVLLCLHIPISTKSLSSVKEEGKRHDMQNLFDAVELISGYANPMVFSGHTHTNFKNTLSGGVREFTVGAMSGCWWWSRNCADGSPNGYLVCRFEGNRLVSHIYKGLGFSDRHQMRIYRGDAVFGGKFEAFPMQYGHNTLLINVFNWDEDWKVEVYENGRLCASELQPMERDKDFVPTDRSSKDWWAIGYNVGVIGRGHAKGSRRNNYCAQCWHMFRYDVQDPSAKVKVVVTDGAGRRFSESKIYECDSWENADYSEAVAPEYEETQIY